MSAQLLEHEPHGSPCSSLGSALSRKRSRDDAGLGDLTTPPPSRRCSREVDDRSRSRLPTPYYTPPASESGSPCVKSEGFHGSLPPIDTTDTLSVRMKEQQPSSSPVKLPSLQEFDQGVQALVDTNSPPLNPSPQSLPSFKAVFNPQLPSLQTYQAPEESLPAAASSPYVPAPPEHRAGYAPSFYSSSSLYHTPRTPYTTLLPGYSTPELSPEELYPHAQPKQQNKHCNKKYTVEEGDFIIYLWHDKKLKWEQVQSEFARIFGSEPRRSTQGLQAWYYRMNAIIPCWDSQGYLIFENDDIVEPKTRQIKVRDKERGEVNAEPLGLAQRYPERGMAYSWVEHKDKIAMSDWASKRIQQFNERRERRRQKEERRAVDMQEVNHPRHIIQPSIRPVAPLSYRSPL